MFNIILCGMEWIYILKQSPLLVELKGNVSLHEININAISSLNSFKNNIKMIDNNPKYNVRYKEAIAYKLCDVDLFSIDYLKF